MEEDPAIPNATGDRVLSFIFPSQAYFKTDTRLISSEAML